MRGLRRRKERKKHLLVEKRKKTERGIYCYQVFMFCGYRSEGEVMIQTKNDGD